MYNLRTDPFERANVTSNTYYDWLIDHIFILYAAQNFAGEFAQTLVEYPPAQKAASFTINQAMDKMSAVAAGGG
jgi:arylsulfatase